MSTQDLIQSLNAIVGPEHVLPGSRAAGFAVSGSAPKAAVLPASEAEAAAVISLASERGLAVVPFGGGTQIEFGERPRAYDIALVLTRLDRVVRYDPDDMTVTVEAGITLERLQETLSRGNQFLPVDPPLPAGATIGGLLATRAFGPLRLGFRTIADRLIGIRVVTARGEIAKAGGRVVKNVSGYEMGRLYTGSFGTLAVITEATFKVQPRLEHREMLAVAVRDLKEADRLAKAIIHSDALPVLMEVAGPCSDPEAILGGLADGAAGAGAFGGEGDGALLVLGYGGTQESVDWQIAEALKIMAHNSPDGAGGPRAHRRLPWEPVHGLLLDLHGRGTGDAVLLRLHVPDASLLARLEEALRLARRAGLAVRLAAHAGSGVARIAFAPAGEAIGALKASGFARDVRALAEAEGGFMLVERAPEAVRGSVGVWGAARGDFFLHRAVKEKLDPKGILSPGRFAGGL